MATKKLVYNGVSSEDLGLVIQAPPAFTYPERDITSTHVPGRNGDIITDNGCYKNVTRTYNIAKGFVYGGTPHLIPNAQIITQWLMSANGKYVRLEDDYDGDVYRLATYTSGGTYTDYFDKALAINVSFNCKPQRFLKSGEIPVVYSSGTQSVVIANNYNFTAKPLIKISQIGTLSASYVLLLTTLNASNIAKSIIVLSNIQNGEDVYIDSEKQNCYNGSSEDINEKINLNGKDFPILENGNNTVSINVYEKKYGDIQSYKTTLNNSQVLYTCEYATKSVLEEAACTKVYIPSYNSIKNKYSETYSAQSYLSYIKAKANIFECSSPNTLLNSACIALVLSGQMSDNILSSELAAIFELTGSDNNYSVLLKSTINGFIRTSEQKKIQYKAGGSTLVSGLSSNKGVTIYYYKAANSTKLELENDINDSSNGLAPAWLQASILVDNNGYVTGFQWKTRLINSSPAYYWTDKDGLMTKEKWTKHSSSGTILNSYTWKTNNVAFMPDASLSFSTSTSKAFTYRFMDSANILQYPDPEDGTTKHFTITISVDSNTNIINGINILASGNSGYFKFNDNNWVAKNSGASISSYSASEEFTLKYLSELPTYAQEDTWEHWVNPKPFPYQNGTIVSNPSDVDILNATIFVFKLADSTYNRWYRVSYDIETSNDGWSVWLKQINPFGTDDPANNEFKSEYLYKKIGTSKEYCTFNTESTNLYVEQIANSSLPSAVYNDRRFIDSSGTQQERPNWINYKVIAKAIFYDNPTTVVTLHRNSELNEEQIDPDTNEYHYYWYDDESSIPIYIKNKETWIAYANDKIYSAETNKEIGYIASDTEIEYYATPGSGHTYYYRWEDNDNWVKVSYSATIENNKILTTSPKDTSKLMFLTNLPNAVVPSSLTGKVTCQVVENSTGNPTEIKYKAGTNGYYRVGSQSNWEYYTSGSLIYTAIPNEADCTVNYLDLVQNATALSNVKITITPNWWML